MAELKVELIEHTPNPERVIATAAKLCYADTDIDKLYGEQTEESIERFLDMLTSIGHESPMEHVSFTFAIEGVSRALTHQLVRHRIASYSQQSQRYVKLGDFDYIIPPSIANNEFTKSLFINNMRRSQEDYEVLVDILTDQNFEELKAKAIADEVVKYPSDGGMPDIGSLKILGKLKNQSEKMAIEDARYVFPNACESKIIVTMNARSLFNFFKHRCCNRAQWEIRELALRMLTLCQQVAPTLFKNCGPSCVTGKCSEGKMSCGNIPVQFKKVTNKGV